MDQLEKKYEHYSKIKDAIEYLDENYQYQPKLDDVASHIGLSKHHFARVFKEYVGITPMQFLQATTFSHAKESLKNSKSNLDTSLNLGLSSSSRLHELFINFVGVTPNEYKKMGNNLEITYGFGYSPYGKTMIASTPKGICALEFYESSHEDVFERLTSNWKNAKFAQDNTLAQEELNKIFIHKEKIDLYVKGTNFQINVWKALLNIKEGEVFTYSDIAELLGKPKSVRAVATAIASNHIGYLIPCHRVISKTAAMGGYRWGIPRKKILLACETFDTLSNNQ